MEVDVKDKEMSGGEYSRSCKKCLVGTWSDFRPLRLFVNRGTKNPLYGYAVATRGPGGGAPGAHAHEAKRLWSMGIRFLAAGGWRRKAARRNQGWGLRCHYGCCWWGARVCSCASQEQRSDRVIWSARSTGRPEACHSALPISLSRVALPGLAVPRGTVVRS
jgi:hypothetical protein